MSKKLVTGITAAGSVGLLPGQLSYFKSKGYKTYLLSPKTGRSVEYSQQENCELLELEIERNISLWKDLKSLFRVIRIFLKVKPDIVNLGTPKVALLGLIAAKLLGVKRRIYTCRGFRYEHEKGRLRSILIFMEKITAFCAQDVICISQSVKDLGVSYNIFKNNKAVVINKGSSNGIDLKKFSPNGVGLEAELELKKKYSLESYFVFGFVGRIIDRKGINELYQAFVQLNEVYADTKLLIVGPLEREQLADDSLIKKIQDHPNIIWPGRTDDVPTHLKVMDVFVLPAWWEGFGNVLVQAAAMGIPVISTTGTGTIDAVSDGFNGTLVPVKDVQALKNAMEDLYKGKELRLKYSENGLIWSKNFQSELIWNGMIELFEKP
ncbi:MAG: glycosyltransferase family 4 protein [Bacteroidia bacterium]